MRRIRVNCGWQSRQIVMGITHSFARGPLKEITEILSTSSGVHPCRSIQRQASSIRTQNLHPASHSCPSWISASQGDPSSQPKNSPLETAASQTVMPQPKRKLKVKESKVIPSLLDTGTVLPRSLPYQEGKDYGDC